MKGFLVLQIIHGPLFIVGTVGISMFGSSSIGFLLLFSHILACITVGIIFSFWNPTNSYSKRLSASNITDSSVDINISNLGSIIATAISNSISTILLIGGFVVIFSVIISILKTSNTLFLVSKMLEPVFNLLHIPSNFSIPFITGFLEITNGISLIANIHIKAISVNIIITSFLLGLGGISIFLQVLSITSKTDLSIKPYIYGKLLHAIISSFYTFIFIQAFPWFNLNL